MNASHILVPTLDEAKNLKRQIDGGMNFEQLARAHSKCPSSQYGGTLGFFDKGAMVKPFEDAVVALEVGQVSEPVQTQFGWHLIKRFY